MPPSPDTLAERLQGGLPRRYTLDRQLGRGGMAVVYLAREQHPKREVAIKVLDPIVTVGIGRERFLREIDFVSKLTHPHIVPVFAAGEADGLLYFVMPYVAGESLADRIAREGRIGVTAALRFTADVAQALEYAHRREIVHRDIKPENILLHDDFALVADFGVARAVRAARDERSTRDSMTLGTPAYMSPEQAGGDAGVDPRSDIYSLGCLLYHMLAGEPPFGHGPWDQVMQQQARAAPPPLATRVPGVPAEVGAIVDRAMAKRPADRFATAGDLAAAVASVRATLDSGERLPMGLAGRTIRPRTLTLAVVGVVAVIAAVLVSRPAPIALPPLTGVVPLYAESLAVMPVENRTGRPDLDRVADAVTFEVITALHRVPDLKVPAYASVRQIAQTGASPRVLAEQLGVRLLLFSSLRQSGDGLRFDAELVDGRTDEVLDVGSLPLQTTIGSGLETSLVRRMQEMVRRGAKLEASPSRVAVLEGPAYDAYRVGRHLISRRTPAGVRRAIGHFNTAVSLDSTYGPAYAGLASAYTLALFYRYEIGIDGYDAAARALAAAERAVNADPLWGPGYGARGYVISRTYGPTERAARDFTRAVALAPNEVDAVGWSGAVLAWEGDTARAFAETRRAAELDPLSPATQLSLALVMLSARDYDVAVSSARRASELEPELMESRAVAGRALLLAGRPAECVDIDFGPHGAIRAACLHAVGRTTEAGAIIDSIVRAVETGALHDTAYTDILRADGLASYFAWTGDAERAFAWLEYAFARSPMGVDRRVLESAMFDGLRTDPGTRRRLDQLTARIWPRVARTQP